MVFLRNYLFFIRSLFTRAAQQPVYNCLVDFMYSSRPAIFVGNKVLLKSRVYPVLDVWAAALIPNYYELSLNLKPYLANAYAKFGRGVQGESVESLENLHRYSFLKGVRSLASTAAFAEAALLEEKLATNTIKLSLGFTGGNNSAYVSHMKDGLVFVTNINNLNLSIQCTVAIHSASTGRVILGNVIDFNEAYARVYSFEGNSDINIFDRVTVLRDVNPKYINSCLSSSLKIIAPFIIDSRSSDNLSSVTEQALISMEKNFKFSKNFKFFNQRQQKITFEKKYAKLLLKKKHEKKGSTAVLGGTTWAGGKKLGFSDLEESLCIRVSSSILGTIITSTGNVLYQSKKHIKLTQVPDTLSADLHTVSSDASSTSDYRDLETTALGDRVRNFFINYVSDTKTYNSFLLDVKQLSICKNLSKYFNKSFRNSEVSAPSVMNRKKVIDPIATGVTLVDILFPVGKGQRQLIIGDRQTGKTTIALDTIINQSKRSAARGFFGFTPTVSIYVSIGQRQSEVYSILNSLKKAKAMANTVIVSSPSNSPCSFQFLSAYTGTTIAEHFRDSGKSVVVIYDDLSKHAVAYRQLSLMLRRSPSRESYPSDIFFVHARLLERSSFLRSGGSLTAFPVVETLSNDVSAFIPTNVISITDGQLFLESSLFIKGNKPAIGIGFSVSRIGASAQSNTFKALSPLVRSQLAKYRSLEALKSFSDDLDAYTIRALQRGERIWDVMKQAPRAPYDLVCQGIFSYSAVSGLLDSLSFTQVTNFKKALLFDICSGFLGFEIYNVLGSSLFTRSLEYKIKLYTSSVVACLKNSKTTTSLLNFAKKYKFFTSFFYHSKTKKPFNNIINLLIKKNVNTFNYY